MKETKLRPPYHCAPPLLLILSVLMLFSRCAQAAPTANWMWIWTAEGARPPETVFFRQSFRLPAAPTSARLMITADDSFTAYLNEGKKPVAQGHDWTTVQEFNVTRSLRAGANLLAVEANNANGSAGLLYKLRVTLPGGKTRTFFSDSRVRANRRVPPVWTTFAVDDSRWPFAAELAPANGGVWGKLRGAPLPDPARIVRLWNLRAGGSVADNPYSRSRAAGDRMIMSASVSSASDMQMLAGAGFTLFQTDSNHLTTEETAPNQWNWHEANASRQATQSLGLDWSYFPHNAFPPAWYRKSVPFTRIQCLEHQQPVEAFSPWDPTWPAFIDHSYEALEHEFGANKAQPGSAPKTAGLYVGIHGDYGEAGLLVGARVSVPGQKEDWLRRFGNLHDHLGWWCYDPLARADFRAVMLQKYGSLSALNAAWKREYKTPEEITYPDKLRPEARREWLDWIEWYQNTVGKAVELNLSAARKHFPETLLMLPAGFGDEDLRGGNDNSLLPKLAAHYKADLRSTHGAFKPFAENAATMLGRLGSASRFYGVPFWTEPPGALTPDQEVERIFEAVSQGSKGLFDWAGNAIAARDVYYRYSKFLRVEKPVTDVAMFYPSTAMRLRPDQSYPALFAQACTYLRESTNYDIVDERMVLDGSLDSHRVLIMWEGNVIEQSVLDKIKAWVNAGGTLVAYDFGKIQNVEGDLSWFRDLFGYVREVQPAKVTEKYVGKIPSQYRIAVGAPESADYLGGEWFEPETVDGVARRWTGGTATVRLPVKTDQRYVLVIRATIPPETVALKRQLLINGTEVGTMDSPGDVTYRFLVSSDLLENHPLTTLTIKSETFQPAKRISGSRDERNVGISIHSVQLVEQGADETQDMALPPGSLRREMDLRRLNTDWTRRYGKGLTIYFPANRQLLKGYLEVALRAIYHLSEIDPGRRNALPIDAERDGVYATLFTDKILYYNSKDTPVTKTVTIPPEAFASWRGEVAMPSETSWKLALEPHSIGAIYFTPPPQELLFECEKFTDLGMLKPTIDANCSPGKGPSCVILRSGAAIGTRFPVDAPGRYAVYVRATRQGRPEPVELLLDGQPIPPVNTKFGQTFLNCVVNLTRGTHTLTLHPRAGQEARADFVLFTNDPTIAGYTFASRTVPVE